MSRLKWLKVLTEPDLLHSVDGPGADNLAQLRKTSATLQAWAIQPRG